MSFMERKRAANMGGRLSKWHIGIDESENCYRSRMTSKPEKYTLRRRCLEVLL
jgi:hypothetical protein